MKKYLIAPLLLLSFCSFSKFNIPETPFSDYVFEAKECRVIHHNDSRIFIPSYAFYLDGKLYDGTVHLKYREFRDQLDILINHLPMAYYADGKQHTLESAGMFELKAYGNGKLLSFAPDKKAQVHLSKNRDLTGGETYVLNENSKVWEKATPFAANKESNQILSDNSQDLWGDNIWRNDDNGLSGANIAIVDDSGFIQYVRVLNSSFTMMNVDKMAIYNCDKILNEDNVPIVADFKLEGYSEKLKSEVFVVYKNRNAVISYFPEQFTTDFKLLPNEAFTIFTFSLDGKIAVLDKGFSESFDAKTNANRKVTFPMKVFKNQPKTKEALAAITGL